jgi:MFS transporter, PHS family, inorganic phosphate transporter
MLASVFFCQPLGQLLGMIVSLVVLTAYRDQIPTDSETCTTPECIRALDGAWRWIVGFGSIPAVVALFFRLTIPESPHYLLDIVGAVKSASHNTQVYYNGDAFGQSQELMEAGQNSQEFTPAVHAIPKPSTERTASLSSNVTRDSIGAGGLAPNQSPNPSPGDASDQLPSPMLTPINDDVIHYQSGAGPMHVNSVPSSIHSAELASPNEQQPPKASWQDAKQFFIKEKNWIYLAATSSAWFCLDVSPLLSLNLQPEVNVVSLPSMVCSYLLQQSLEKSGTIPTTQAPETCTTSF